MREYLYCVLVTGGRDYPDRARVFQYLDAVSLLCGGDVMLIHGGARGADTFAEEWAREREQISVRIPAQWDKYQKAAGFKRNAEMAAMSNANYVVVFRGGRGTMNMLGLARNMEPRPEIILADGEFWR